MSCSFVIMNVSWFVSQYCNRLLMSKDNAIVITNAVRKHAPTYSNQTTTNNPLLDSSLSIPHHVETENSLVVVFVFVYNLASSVLCCVFLNEEQIKRKYIFVHLM